MQQTEVTFRQAYQFQQFGMQFINNPANFSTKLGYAVKKMLDKMPRILEPVNELETKKRDELNDVYINHCETNEKGHIIYDITKSPRGEEIRNFVYTKENQKKVNQEVSAIVKKYEKLFQDKFDEKVGFETLFVSDGIPNLSPVDLDIMKGIVLAMDYEPKAGGMEKV